MIAVTGLTSRRSANSSAASSSRAACCVDLARTVRNVGSVPRKFWCAIASHSSIVDRRENLLRNCSGDRRPLDYARSWWKEDHQRLVDLPEEEARRIEATLARCADGSPRRDLRVAQDMI